MNYFVSAPPTVEVGSYTCTVSAGYGQTYRAAALQDYNSARARDGLEPVRRMPAGTVYKPLYEYVIQGMYSGKWEDEHSEETRKGAVYQVARYRESCPGTAFRFVRRPA